MQKLEPPDTHHLSAAMGWIELGSATEAESELLRLSPDASAHPAALEVWFALHAERHDWVAGLRVAGQLVELMPHNVGGWLHRAYALRRVPGGGLSAALEALLPASEKFPEEPTVAYNLACYTCQLGRTEEAWKWFERAVQTGGQKQIVPMALTDEDLKPLHLRIAQEHDDCPF